MIRNGIRRLGYSTLLFTHLVFAQVLDVQRDNFHQAEQALNNGQLAEAKQRLPALKDYPLYPYLKYGILRHNLSEDDSVEVKQFIDSYPNLPIASSLKNNFINELARRGDWIGILKLSATEPSSMISRCHWFLAKLHTGEKQRAWQGADEIWLTGKNLPVACNPLFEQWHAVGLLTANKQLQRLILAYEVGNYSLVKYLLAGLPADFTTIKQQLQLLLNNPSNLARFAELTSPTTFSRQISMIGFRRLARLDAEQARNLIPNLSLLQKMSLPEQQLLKDTVVWQFMGRELTPEQQQWRDNVIIHSTSEALKERRVRLAMTENDNHGMTNWLTRLPVEAKQKQEWRYWQAVLLHDAGHDQQATEIFTRLADERGFYPMVAAQRLGRDYLIKSEPYQTEALALPDEAALQRVIELKYWQKDNDARAEWASLIVSLPERQQHRLVNYALNAQWWDLAVTATIKAKMWGSIPQRFPLAYQAVYQSFGKGKLITPSYAMAIARQESGLNPDIQSAAGAIGLMQLMPATAKHTAKIFKITDYRSPRQLRNPAMNIRLGMQYLDYLYQKFEQNRILASAAYNAGPSRVQSWLQQSLGQLDPVAFIETIPFAETRNYVKFVLTYDGYYQFLLGKPKPIFTHNEWNRKY